MDADQTSAGLAGAWHPLATTRLLNILVICMSCIVAIAKPADARGRVVPNIEHVLHSEALLSLEVPTAPSSTSAEDTVEPYFDRAGRVVRLSTVGNLAFRLPSQSFQENFDLNLYEAALKKFTTVRSCLIKAEQEHARPDLTRFDWKAISNHGEAYVCFSLIFTSYETAADVMWWMTRQRMLIQRSYATYQVKEPENASREFRSSGKFGLRVSGGFLNAPYKAKEQTFLQKLLEVGGYGIVAHFSETDGIVSLNIIAHRLK